AARFRDGRLRPASRRGLAPPEPLLLAATAQLDRPSQPFGGLRRRHSAGPPQRSTFSAPPRLGRGLRLSPCRPLPRSAPAPCARRRGLAAPEPRPLAAPARLVGAPLRRPLPR